MNVSFYLPHPVAVNVLFLFVEAGVRVLIWCECMCCM